MSQGIELPDETRREDLTTTLDSLKKARTALPDEKTAEEMRVEDTLADVFDSISTAISEARDELDEIPEWDRGLVQDLVLKHAGRRDTTVERVDNEVVLQFSEGPMGRETEMRYAVAVTSGNEWFHVKKGGEWDKVWSN